MALGLFSQPNLPWTFRNVGRFEDTFAGEQTVRFGRARRAISTHENFTIDLPSVQQEQRAFSI